jgi:hypothetical protein
MGCASERALVHCFIHASAWEGQVASVRESVKQKVVAPATPFDKEVSPQMGEWMELHAVERVKFTDLCGCCKLTQYCCMECQASDWPEHRTFCRNVRTEAEGEC